MTDSILLTIKQMVGLVEENTHFDETLIVAINSVFTTLSQLGSTDFSITGTTEKWSDYSNNTELTNMIKSYMKLKVQLLFDPPANSVLVSCMERQIEQYEWRINVLIDNKKVGEING